MTDPLLVLVTNAGADAIASYRLTPGDPVGFESLARSATGASCTCFAVDEDRDLVHVGLKGDDPAILTMALDRSTGELTELRRTPCGEPAAYLTLVRDGSLLLGASYAGASGYVYRVEDGKIGERTASIAFRNLHCAISTAAGDFAYYVSLGEDLIAQYSLAADGTLTPLPAPTVPLPTGCGARHLVLSPDERTAYLMTEYSGEVFRFDRDPETGELSRQESVPAHDTSKGLGHSRFGAEPLANHFIWGADIHLSPDGRWLYTSERCESDLMALSLDPDGHLGKVETIIDTETQPRGFALSPDGQFMVVVGERSDHAALYAVDAERLTLLSRAPTGERANWVKILPAG